MGFLRSMGWPEWILILVIVLLIFGPKRLPDLARGLGKGIRGFKEEIKDKGGQPAPEDAKEEE